ncbi:MAG TPA: hypothetical protein VGJ92_04015 [Methanocella sp.]|jgi:hypothetical protein
MSGISLNMNCPNCGGALSLKEGSHYTSCAYCTAMLAVEGDEGISKITFKDKITRVQAVEAVQHWWRGGFKARDLKTRGLITESYPIYVPFWRLKARAAGWVCGYRTETHTDSKGNTHTKKVPLEKMIVRDFDWSHVACDPGDIGIEHLRNFEGEAVLHDEGSIPTFEATTSRTDAIADGSQQVMSEAVSYAGVPTVTFQDVHVFPKDLSIVFYPIWVVRYTYSERMYFATVDGITGSVLSGRAPGDNLWRSLAMAAGMAIGGIGSAFSLSVLLSGGSEDTAGIGIVGMIICLAVAAGAFVFFRYGSEMTTGDVKGGFNLGGSSSRKAVQDEVMKQMAPQIFGRMRR